MNGRVFGVAVPLKCLLVRNLRKNIMSRWQHSGPPVQLQSFYRKHSRQVLTSRGLRQQGRVYQASGGSSGSNQGAGFVPAFLDQATGQTYVSTFADGSAAPMHLLDGLPEAIIVRRSRTGKVTAVHGSVTAGFLRAGKFFSRQQASEQLVAEGHQPVFMADG